MIERHGWNATAFQTLESGYSYFFHGRDACVAYVDLPGAWVAAGSPLAPGEELGPTAAAFVQAARAAGKRACFFGTESRFVQSRVDGLRSICIGEQPSWDPRQWPALLATHRSLREQLRRARVKGVVVRELTADEIAGGPTHDAMREIATRWLAARPLAPMGFLVRLQPFTHPEHRACFVAEVDGRVVAFAGVIPVPARRGFFLEDLVRDRDTPNGTSEQLVDAVMRWAARRDSPFVTLGLAPLAGEVPRALRIIRAATRRLYDFDGLHRYKAKLRPSTWTPIHLSYPETQSAVVSVIDALAAFTDGGFLRFAMRTLTFRTRRAHAVAALAAPPHGAEPAALGSRRTRDDATV